MPLNPILVAEDDPSDVFFLQRIFKACRVRNPLEVVTGGLDVIGYISGEGKYADRNRYPMPAMILLDWFMSPGSGEQVLDWLQTQPKPNFPVVVLTGMQSLHEMRVAYQKGAHSFLVKPLEEGDVRNFLEKFRGIEVEPAADASTPAPAASA